MPAGAYRLPGPGRDGVMVARDGALTRALWVAGEAAVVRAWPVSGAVRIRAEADSPEAAAEAVERMRFALGTNHDLTGFHFCACCRTLSERAALTVGFELQP